MVNLVVNSPSIWEARAGGISADPSLPISHPSQDRYRYDDYAEVLAGCILNASPEEPLTIGIEGTWGSGKTSLVRLLQHKFRTSYRGLGQKVLIFDAWTKDQDEQGADEFYRWLLQSTYRERSPIDSLIDPAPDNLVTAEERRRRGRRRAFVLLGILLGILAWFKTNHQFALSNPWWIAAVGTASLGFTPVVVWELMRGGLRLFGLEGLYGLGQGNSPDEITSQQRLAELTVSEMKRVLPKRSARLVVVVDNLDRCRPKTAVEILEAMDQMVQEIPLLLVVPADFSILACQLEDEYKRRDGTNMVHAGFGRMFLERLVTMPFALPDRPLADPFVRQMEIDDSEDEEIPHVIELTGELAPDIRKILNSRPAVIPRRFDDILLPHERGQPRIRNSAGLKKGLISGSACLIAGAISTGPLWFSRVARQEYPFARRPQTLGGIALPTGNRVRHAIACFPFTLGLTMFTLSVLTFLLGSILVTVAALLASIMNPTFFLALGASIIPLFNVALFLFQVGYILALAGFLWLIFLAASWASEMRSEDEAVVMAAIDGPEGWEPKLDNPRIPAKAQLDLRLLFAHVRADPQLGTARAMMSIRLLNTERGRKRMANRARILRKLAQRRKSLQSITAREIVAWSIIQEMGALPGSASWKEVDIETPGLSQLEPALRRLGLDDGPTNLL